MVLIGDLHGGYPELLYKIKKYKLENTSFIQVGDWGLGFQRRELDLKALVQIDSFLQEQANRLYIIRGNHDNKWFWDNRDALKLQQIVLVQDYELLAIDGKKILFIGGGISIDRIGRTEGQDYWKDEGVNFDTLRLQSACLKGVDITVTHIAPQEAWPHVLNDLVHHYIDQEKLAGRYLLSTELEHERQVMSNVLAAVKAAGCKEWYYGHYHESYVEDKDGMNFRCLGIQEIYERPV